MKQNEITNKKQFVKQCIKEYIRAKRSLDLIGQGYFYLLEPKEGESDRDFINHLNAIKANIDSILVHMDQEYSRIITLDFIDHRDYFWWRDHYSRSTYYRRRERAIDEFINFYQI